MTNPLYTSRGKGFREIQEDAERILDGLGILREDGTTVITAQVIEAVLEQVDERSHFMEPMAQGLYRLIIGRGGHVVLPPVEKSEEDN